MDAPQYDEVACYNQAAKTQQVRTVNSSILPIHTGQFGVNMARSCSLVESQSHFKPILCDYEMETINEA